jgi:hypothetical protein
LSAFALEWLTALSKKRTGIDLRTILSIGLIYLRMGVDDESNQVTKSIWWMPWRTQAMKDVVRCDKPWGAANKL